MPENTKSSSEKTTSPEIRLRAWLEVISGGRYNGVADKLARKALAGEEYVPPEPVLRVCSICGISEGEPDYDILGDVRVITMEGEEGYSDVTMLLCEENDHLGQITTMLKALGFMDHNHGGTSLLQDENCIRAQYDPDTHLLLPCPTPADRPLRGSLHRGELQPLPEGI